MLLLIECGVCGRQACDGHAEGRAAHVVQTCVVAELHPRRFAGVLAARRLGVSNELDRERLVARRLPDGSWPAEGWFCYGRSRQWFGSSALSTAFAIAALGQ